MQVQEMGLGTACYLVSEANGTRSREVITVAQGHNLLPGAVLGWWPPPWPGGGRPTAGPGCPAMVCRPRCWWPAWG